MKILPIMETGTIIDCCCEIPGEPDVEFELELVLMVLIDDVVVDVSVIDDTSVTPVASVTSVVSVCALAKLKAKQTREAAKMLK